MKKLFENKWFTIGIVIIIYLTISFYKIYLTKNLPKYNSYDDTGFYSSESAFQYRYAKMVADGKQIPQIDYKAQYPEGVNTKKELTILMEKIHGWIYRWAKFGVLFHVFLIFFVSFFSSLSIFIVYFLAQELWNNKIVALICLVFYAVCRATFSRTIGNYIYEDFALPFIFTSILFFIKSLNSERVVYYSIFSGICISVGLSSWHFSRFYFLVFIIVVISCYFIYKPYQNILEKYFKIIISFCFITSIVVPVLREKMFLLSLPMIISYTFLFFCMYNKYQTLKIKKTLLCIGLFWMFLIFAQIFGKEKEYSHVYAVFFYKLVNFFQKPSDPTKLSDAARSLWIEAFNSPQIGDTIYLFGSLLLLGCAAVLIFLSKTIKFKLDIKQTIIFLFFLFWSSLYLFIERLSVILSFFLAVLIGNTFLYVLSLRKKPIKIFCLYSITLFTIFEFSISINARKTHFFAEWVYKVFPKQQTNILMIPGWTYPKLCEWIKNNTTYFDIFLGDITVSPHILTDSDRAVLLHPKFESLKIRNKYMKFAYALYKDEDAFYEFCRINRVTYFVYEADKVLENTTDSLRYVAGKIRIRKDSVVYKFHFEPHNLKHFALVWQLRSFRVFKFVTKTEKHIRYYPPYDALYDISLYGTQNDKEYFDDSRNLDIFSRIQLKEKLRAESQIAMTQKNYKLALKRLYDAVATNIPDQDVYCEIAAAYYYSNSIDEAIKNIYLALDIDPYYVSALGLLGTLLIEKKDYIKAFSVFQKIVKIKPNEVKSYIYLGYIFYKRGLLEKANNMYSTALKLDPNNQTAKRGLEMIVSQLKKP